MLYFCFFLVACLIGWCVGLTREVMSVNDALTLLEGKLESIERTCRQLYKNDDALEQEVFNELEKLKKRNTRKGK